MSDVQFDTDNQFNAPIGSTAGIVQAENKMATWLMRKGFARSERSAMHILLSVAVGAVVLALAGWVLVYPHDRSGQASKGNIDKLYKPATSRSK